MWGPQWRGCAGGTRARGGERGAGEPPACCHASSLASAAAVPPASRSADRRSVEAGSPRDPSHDRSSACSCANCGRGAAGRALARSAAASTASATVRSASTSRALRGVHVAPLRASCASAAARRLSRASRSSARPSCALRRCLAAGSTGWGGRSSRQRRSPRWTHSRPREEWRGGTGPPACSAAAIASTAPCSASKHGLTRVSRHDRSGASSQRSRVEYSAPSSEPSAPRASGVSEAEPPPPPPPARESTGPQLCSSVRKTACRGASLGSSRANLGGNPPPPPSPFPPAAAPLRRCRTRGERHAKSGRDSATRGASRALRPTRRRRGATPPAAARCCTKRAARPRPSGGPPNRR